MKVKYIQAELLCTKQKQCSSSAAHSPLSLSDKNPPPTLVSVVEKTSPATAVLDQNYNLMDFSMFPHFF